MYEDLGPIGGAEHLIEIDEMKMGRRKYNRGRVVDGSWILGFVDIVTKCVWKYGPATNEIVRHYSIPSRNILLLIHVFLRTVGKATQDLRNVDFNIGL